MLRSTAASRVGSQWTVHEILLFVLYVALVSSETYNETLARNIVPLTEVAYCTTRLENWDCALCGEVPSLANVTLLDGKSRNARGFIGLDLNHQYVSQSSPPQRPPAWSKEQPLDQGRYLRGLPAIPSSPHIVIVFAGTDPKSFKNWIDDLEFSPISHAYAGCDNCRVHRGFLDTYGAVRLKVHETVKHLLHDHPHAKITITGHSLGGALATLCLLDLVHLLGFHKLYFNPLYIFGSPRVGNAAFAQHTASLGIPVFRVVHHRDPVPHLPFKTWGYVHPAQEIFYTFSQSEHVICDAASGEDPSCSNKYWVTIDMAFAADHVTYLQADYTRAYLKCVMGSEDVDESTAGRASDGILSDEVMDNGANIEVQ